jgi:hypothetical protein
MRAKAVRRAAAGTRIWSQWWKDSAALPVCAAWVAGQLEAHRPQRIEDLVGRLPTLA